MRGGWWGVPSTSRLRGAQPQRYVRRLHRFRDDALKRCAERREVDLFAQARVELPERLRGVVLAAIEAPVHRLLDARPSRAEQRCDGECGRGDREIRRWAQDQLE